MGSLVVIAPSFLAWLVIASLAGWGLCVVLARRRGRRPAAAAGLLAGLLTLATAGDAVNAHYGFLPRLDDVVGHKTWPTAPYREVAEPVASRTPSHPRGAVVDIRLPGRRSAFGAPKALVYLPPHYFREPARRFPVVYLLHGTPGAPIDWFRAARAADVGALLAAGGTPAILVAPRVSRDWTDDSECVDRPNERIETYVVGDVVPAVDARFRTLAGRQGRAVAGVSAGGFCALNVGLRHRDTFGTVVDLSGYSRPTHDGGMAALFGRRPDLARVVAANDPSRYAHLLPPRPSMRIWLDCGRQDRAALRDVRPLADVLRGRGYEVVLRLRGGGHDYGVWRPALRDALRWAAPGLVAAPVGPA